MALQSVKKAVMQGSPPAALIGVLRAEGPAI